MHVCGRCTYVDDVRRWTAVRMWTMYVCECTYDAVRMWTSTYVDNVRMWTMYVCGRCAYVDDVRMWTMYVCGRCT